MKRYLCIESCEHGPFTEGKIYKIKHGDVPKRDGYKLYYYDDNHRHPGHLNNFWFKRGFKEIKELSNNIKIL